MMKTEIQNKINIVVKKTSEMSDFEKNQINDLFNEVFNMSRTFNEFELQFEKNQVGYSYFGILYIDNILAGSYAVIPQNYKFFKYNYLFGQSVDTIIKKNYRGNPYNIKKLAEKVYLKLLNENIKFVFGFPNENIYLVRKKLLKWITICDYDVYVAPANLITIPIINYINIVPQFLLKLFNICSIFKRKNIIEKNKPISKLVFSGDEEFRDKNYTNIVQLYNGCLVHFIVKTIKKFSCLIIVDLSVRNVKNLEIAINELTKKYKTSNFIIFSGKLPFNPKCMIKIPNFFIKNKLRLCGRIIDKNFIDSSIFECNNWELNLSNTDYN